MLEIKNLHKSYGNLTAVTDLSFSLNPGDIFGFIGSNGAGKTTTIRMLATLLEPTRGTATLDGYDILKDPTQIRKLIGYMPDFFGLYDDIKVWEYLDFFAAIYRIPVNQRPGVIDNVLELVDLTVKKDAFVQSLSRGMQQRLCLARCLVHDPTLLLLDEPASGLDPRARAELKELILELGRMGKIIIVSSHILPELADFCNKVGIIEKGNLLAFGPVQEITRAIRPTRRVLVRLLSDRTAAIQHLNSIETVSGFEEKDDNLLFVDIKGDEMEQAQLLRHLVSQGVDIIDYHEDAANLEDVFLRLTTGAVQ